VEAEAALVEHRRLPGVAHEQLEVVDAFDWAKIWHDVNYFGSHGMLVQQKVCEKF
jgi:hypothetical protein